MRSEGDAHDDLHVRSGERARFASPSGERPGEGPRGDLVSGEHSGVEEGERAAGAGVAVGHHRDPHPGTVLAEDAYRHVGGAVGGERFAAQRIRRRRDDEGRIETQRVGDAGSPDIAQRPGHIGLDLADVQRDVGCAGESHGEERVAGLGDAAPERVPERGRARSIA